MRRRKRSHSQQIFTSWSHFSFSTDPAWPFLHWWSNTLESGIGVPISPYSDRVEEGVVLDMMIHDVDLVLWLARSEPVRVNAEQLARRTWRIGTDGVDFLPSSRTSLIGRVTRTLW